ncbi:hypothetical protein Tco_1402706 [Tanacetum coccineum]
MSLEDSDDLNIPDIAPVDPALEADALPKFDMHLYRSSLNESHVRAAPIAMAWRHHDSSVAGPFPRPNEYNESDVAKLREVVISLRRPPLSILYVAGLSNVWKHVGRDFSINDSEGKVITIAEFLRLPNFKGCKVAAETLLPPNTARVTHLSPPVAWLEDIPPKTRDMIVAEIPCRKVVDDKEKKKKKAEEKAATKAPVVDIQAEAVVAKATGKEGPRKKRRVRVGAQVPPDSEHVSSPTPLNQAKPLEALANEEHVSPPLSVGRMDTLRDQTDEHAVSPRVAYTSKPVADEGGGGKVMLTPLMPSRLMAEMRVACPVRRFALVLFIPPVNAVISWKSLLPRMLCRMRKLVILLDALAIFPLLLNGGSQTQAVWITHADLEVVCQSAQQQANVLLRFEALKEQHADLVYAHESCMDVKARFKECRKELAAEKSLQDRLEELEEEKKEADNLNSSQADRIKQLEEALKQAEPDAKVQSTREATPNVDPASSETFLPAYEKLFDQRYPYVDKVARMYLLDPTELQNIMPDETGPTPGGGPCDTPTASYA